MTSIEMQACLARLYVDGSFRKLFRIDPKCALERYVLSLEERRALAEIDPDMLEFFALSLKLKRRKRLEVAYPATFALDGTALSLYIDRYHEIYPLRPHSSGVSEVAQFGAFMEESLRDAAELPGFSSDVVRFERLAQELGIQMRGDGDGGPRRAIAPRPTVAGGRPARRPGVSVARFAYDVSEIVGALREGREPDGRRQEAFVVFTVRSTTGEARMLRVSPATAFVIELCDGRRSVADIASVSEATYGVADLEREVSDVIERLVSVDVLEIVEVADASAP